ncbi:MULTISPECIES: PAAR domain-containing protein [unclassified Pseudomonas]|uniref:PAAR domain-containing protein n=1 Tax=unclassified Pseudomonas TaxID=196821 RepID=UPI002096C34A|nr:MULTISPECIES: PAAR domain-containing protein [unclassified Pseudomonas]MCO7521287.1 PAAR domain-containing protein [Pseudomonas sp. 1]MCO7539856.1 PAAR domain-containing protein [Pseudomonas sp. VA159-2]
MYRVSLDGKGQAVDGDVTTTGAICIASGESYICDGRKVLRVGDSTTECPLCCQPGVVVEGYLGWISDGQPLAMDGSLVACGCPNGSNRVVAPLGGMAPSSHSMHGRQTTAATAPSARTLHAPASAQMPGAIASVQVGLEPGFHIVPRSMSGPQVLAQLLAQDSTLPIARIQRLNPTFDQGFKAGEIFVLGDPDNHHACTREEADLMAAAQRAREALAVLAEQEANFMMQHIGEIAGVLNGASQSMGIGKDMLSRGLGQVGDTLKGLESLHQREFTLHGHLNSPQFFESRRALYQQLNAQLRSAFLGKYLNLGGHESLRKSLNISTKSLVHHWSKAGAPGAVPGYATHLDEVAKMSKYLKYGGHLAVGLGATSSYLKVQDVCRAGETEACKKIRFTETGSFSGGLAGGVAGGGASGLAIKVVCNFGVWGKALCGIAVVGAGSFAGAEGGADAGEWLGELIYKVNYD